MKKTTLAMIAAVAMAVMALLPWTSQSLGADGKVEVVPSQPLTPPTGAPAPAPASGAAVTATAAPASTALPAAPAAGSPAGSAVLPAPAPAPAVAPAASNVSEIEKWIQSTKNPVPWFKWGADVRSRIEHAVNNVALSERSRDRTAAVGRYRSRIWGTLTPVKNVDINARVVWEPRFIHQPGNLQDQTVWNEVVLDNLNVKWKEVFGLPLTVIAGRQDIVDLGDGWLVMDGTPLDGSRTIFFDAARAIVDIKPIQTTIQNIVFFQDANNSQIMTPLNWTHRAVSEQDERGYIFWATNKSIPKTQLDGYFIYKHDDYQYGRGDNADIKTIGGRVSGDIGTNWKYRSEMAAQWGEKSNRDLETLGSNNRLTYLFKDKLNNQLRLSYEYLSGDNPSTAEDEGFDILWGRYPQWSEIYASTMVLEGGRAAQYTNLHRIGTGWSISPIKNMDCLLDYQLLFAPFNNQSTRSGFFSRDGEFRGQLFSAVLKYKFNDHMAGHLWAEFFNPGTYYGPTRQSSAEFLRAELTFTW